MVVGSWQPGLESESQMAGLDTVTWELGFGVLSKQKARAWLTPDGRKASGQWVRQSRPVQPACLHGHHSQRQDASSLELRTGSSLVTMATTLPRKGEDTQATLGDISHQKWPCAAVGTIGGQPFCLFPHSVQTEARGLPLVPSLLFCHFLRRSCALLGRVALWFGLELPNK